MVPGKFPRSREILANDIHGAIAWLCPPVISGSICGGWLGGSGKSRKMRFAFSFNLTLHEETITEFLLLQMARDLTPLGFRVQLYNHFDEGGRRSSKEGGREGHGADWEWYYSAPACMARFRVQAKRLGNSPKRLGKYDAFDPRHRQVRQLISMAGQANPIYVFYNHPKVADDHLFTQSGAPDFFGRNCWGCSVATAAFMLSVSDNKLGTIHPGQVPWHRFFSIAEDCRPRRAMAQMPGDQEFVQADKEPEWVKLLPGNERGRDDRLDGYLAEHGLKGVAYFGLS